MAEVTGDCVDFGVDVNPGVTETCDGIDQDCDGAMDEGTCADGSLCAGASGCIPEVMPPATLSGVIESDIAWQGGGDILVTGTVLIDSEASLSVGPGTRFRFEDNAGLSILGRFSAYGSDEAPVVFESASSSPTPTSWLGLSAMSPDSPRRLNLQHCEVTIVESSLCSTDGSPIATLTDSGNVDLPNISWCTTDTSEIDALIVDDAENPSLGRLNDTPFLTEAHPLSP